MLTTSRPAAARETSPAVAGRGVHDAVRSPGQPLAPDTLRQFSQVFGHDFSSVRVHADRPAAASARALHARAYTVGTHIAFAPGRYQPGEPGGRRLVAHELAHVVQQSRGGSAPPGRLQEQDAEAASAAMEAGEAAKVQAPSRVGLAAQGEQPATASVKAPVEQLRWFRQFYIDRMGYQVQSVVGNRQRLVNPNGGHFVDITIDPNSPRMVSVIVSGKSYEVSEFNFATGRFLTRARHIEMVEYQRELSIPERIGIGFSSTGKMVGGAALCIWGTAETVGFGAVAACAYGADVSASGVRELMGGDSRTLTNHAVSAGLGVLVDEKTAQELTDNAEAAVNIMLTAKAAATPPKPPVVLSGTRPTAPDVAPSTPAWETPTAPRYPTPEQRTPTTPDLGKPAASATPRAVATLPMKRLPEGASRGTMSQATADPIARPPSRPAVEVRTPQTPDYGKPEASMTPESQAPDPWKAAQKPAKPAAPRARPGQHPATGQAASEARAQGLEDLQKGRVGTQEHRSAPAVREATGQTGQNLDSTHLVPQAVYRALGRSPDVAQTVNLPRPVNNAIDSAWVARWNRASNLGQQVTGADIRRWVTEGIRSVPDTMLNQAARNTLEWRLGVELRELGITDDTIILHRAQ